MSLFTKIFCLALLFGSVQFFEPNRTAAQTKQKTVGKKKPTAKPKAVLNLPTVTQIDAAALAALIKRDDAAEAKPLLVNFWATWCDPCREEFPDLVKIDEEYRGKMDFITVSLDELADLKTEVPKFLASMKATMPAYLLKTADEEAAIVSVSKDWQGGLPFTILFDGKGATVYSRQGIVKPDILRTELDKILNPETVIPAAEPPKTSPDIIQINTLELLLDTRFTAEAGKRDAQQDAAAGKLMIKLFGLTPALPSKVQKAAKKYKVEISSIGCLVPRGYSEYAAAYNEISSLEIKRRLDAKAVKELEIIFD